MAFAAEARCWRCGGWQGSNAIGMIHACGHGRANLAGSLIALRWKGPKDSRPLISLSNGCGKDVERLLIHVGQSLQRHVFPHRGDPAGVQVFGFRQSTHSAPPGDEASIAQCAFLRTPYPRKEAEDRSVRPGWLLCGQAAGVRIVRVWNCLCAIKRRSA